MRIANTANMIILNDKDEVLLLKRAEKEDIFVGFWSLPGGGLKGDEDFERAVHREITEETSCRIVSMEYFRSYFYAVSQELHVRSVYFFGTVKGKVKIDSESSEFGWFKLDVVDDEGFKIAFNQRDVLSDFKKFLEERKKTK